MLADLLEPGTPVVLHNTHSEYLVTYKSHDRVRAWVEDPLGFVHDVAWTDPDMWIADTTYDEAYRLDDELLPVGSPPELE